MNNESKVMNNVNINGDNCFICYININDENIIMITNNYMMNES